MRFNMLGFFGGGVYWSGAKDETSLIHASSRLIENDARRASEWRLIIFLSAFVPFGAGLQ
jgi:hypothetical protein